ncbi:NUDIX hydrolase [Flavobacterium cellulosilyticum]|uniref:CoA pyrophosphatase n=1 Tax=Flavobacterium cellulosilyticum TaxID=2541731 RepID=A0A4R5CHW6_9FLAO|nr:CoA pyrophosphatase [Flavobacterium cellulosilyticum]TDD96934.1 CoA pyrophosphatase [Flavobacterium cellulosilyticum]
MDFQDFLNYVPKLLDVTLPAAEAHYKMAPIERIESLKNLKIERKNPKSAAIMMLLYPKMNKTHLVLIVRNSYEGIHSAQIAFPGGKYETQDVTFENTALRETQEEIGISPSKMKIIRAFTQLYIEPSNFIVYPYLGICNEELLFIPDSTEVAEIIELPLSVFLDDKIIVNVNIATSYARNISVPAFNINEHIVWGATAMMLSELKDVLKKVL